MMTTAYQADLRGHDFGGAILGQQNFRGADLRDADFRGACTCGADFRDANLEGARIPIGSHELVGEILRQAAGDARSRQRFAHMVLGAAEWCMAEIFQDLAAGDPERAWAIETLQSRLHPDDFTIASADREIFGMKFRLTCESHPEQYNVYLGDRQVGYVRVRHGHLSVECPECNGQQVLGADIAGDGEFEPWERDYWLRRAAIAVEQF